MRIVIDELAAEEFQRLSEYIQKPENTFEWGDKFDAHLKVKVTNIGEFQTRSVYDNEQRKHLAKQVYRGVELELTDHDNTRPSTAELTDLMKLVYFRGR